MNKCQKKIIMSLLDIDKKYGKSRIEIIDYVRGELNSCEQKSVNIDNELQKLIDDEYIRELYWEIDTNRRYYFLKDGTIKKLLEEQELTYEEVLIANSQMYSLIRTIDENAKKDREDLTISIKKIKLEFLTVIGVFISIFSLVSININFIEIVKDVKSLSDKLLILFSINFSTIFSIYALMGIIHNIDIKGKKIHVFPCAILIVMALLIIICFFLNKSGWI